MMSSAEESNNSDDTSSDGSSIYLAGLAAAVAAYAATKNHAKAPVVDPPLPLPHVTGRQWVEKNLRNREKCYDNFRLYPDAFLELHHNLILHHGLRSTQEVESVEALGMFLWACGTAKCTRQIKDKFDRSLDTISRKMGHVADVMFSFAQTVIAPKDPSYTKVSQRLIPYSPYFDGCIGALNGTHVPVRVQCGSRLDYLNRKGRRSINVLAIVDMEMRFTFVGVGRAGSSHNMSMLTECMATTSYPHPPPGRFYLVDSGYAPREGYLGPYRNTRYHLEEFAERGADSVQEKFNYHHSSLRNFVERGFEVTRNKWQILEGVPSYGREKQIKMIIASFALHNFLLDRGESSSAQINMLPNVDSTSTAWVAANTTVDMDNVRNWIAVGVSLM